MVMEFLGALLPPLLRSIGGWAENSFKDGKIDKFEWLKLGETFVRVLILTAGAYFGLNGIGIDVNALSAGMLALISDFFITSKKAKK